MINLSDRLLTGLERGQVEGTRGAIYQGKFTGKSIKISSLLEGNTEFVVIPKYLYFQRSKDKRCPLARTEINFKKNI